MEYIGEVVAIVWMCLGSTCVSRCFVGREIAKLFENYLRDSGAWVEAVDAPKRDDLMRESVKIGVRGALLAIAGAVWWSLERLS